MKTTWKTTIEDMVIMSLGWRIESADIECDVCITPGEPDTRDCPGSDPVCEIYDIRVLSADVVGLFSGIRIRIRANELFMQTIRNYLIDSGWNQQPELLDRCLQQVSEEIKDADEAAREMADESRRGR